MMFLKVPEGDIIIMKIILLYFLRDYYNIFQ